jgi:hypothetical protein
VNMSAPRQTHLRKMTRVHEDPPEPTVMICGFCQKGPFPSCAGLKRHINNTPDCHRARQAEFGHYASSIWDNIPADAPPAGQPVPESCGLEGPEAVVELDQDLDNVSSFVLESPEPHVPNAPPRTSQQATVEEVPDEDAPLQDDIWYIKEFPKSANTGATWGRGTTMFERHYHV